MDIEVMLMDNVKKLGKSGEIVKVAQGYFRNYLGPKGLAAVATEAAKRRLKKLEAERAARAAEEKKAALAVAKKLEGLALTVSASTTDGKKLYGAVSVTDLLAAIEAQRGVKIGTKARQPESGAIGAWKILLSAEAERRIFFSCPGLTPEGQFWYTIKAFSAVRMDRTGGCVLIFDKKGELKWR